MIQHNHKDRLFRMIFGREENKRWTLSLYNAINGSSYTDPEMIELNTIDDVIYMGMKNDVSFLIADTMNLYEQQSTFNPNMPLRFSIYFGKLLTKYVLDASLNIYSGRIQPVPVPRFICFYNGTKDMPERQELKFSDAFMNAEAQSDIEVRVLMLNINQGKNPELLAACKALNDYSWFVDRIRLNKKTMGISAAVDSAVRMLDEGSEIKPFLVKHMEEVTTMCLTEYDEEATLKMIGEENYQEGIETGRKEGQAQLLELISRLSEAGELDKIEKAANDTEYRNKLFKKYGL
jgi:hypothetical protein